MEVPTPDEDAVETKSNIGLNSEFDFIVKDAPLLKVTLGA